MSGYYKSLVRYGSFFFHIMSPQRISLKVTVKVSLSEDESVHSLLLPLKNEIQENVSKAISKESKVSFRFILMTISGEVVSQLGKRNHIIELNHPSECAEVLEVEF